MSLVCDTIALEISGRNARVTALQKRWDRLRAGLAWSSTSLGRKHGRSAGGASGILARDSKRKEVDGGVRPSAPSSRHWNRQQETHDRGEPRVVVVRSEIDDGAALRQ